MKKEIKLLKQKLNNKQHNNNRDQTGQQPTNLMGVPSNGRDITETENNLEISDILYIISTIMATLKQFESRYKERDGTTMTH